MLRLVASRAIVASAARVEVATQAARYSPQGLKGYDERELAEESVYFRKEEERILRDLLKKISAQAAVHDTENHAAHVAADSKKLDDIVSKYNLSDADKAELLKWKHE